MDQLTWKQFKEFVESKGVKDDTKIDYIDISYHTTIPGQPPNFDFTVSVNARDNCATIED